MHSQTIALKVCKVCGIEKPLEAFYRCRGYQDGHSRTCKVCEQAYKRRPDVMARAREQSTRSHGKKLARRRGVPATFTEKEWCHALRHFGGCAYCGSTEGTLHMDHFIPAWRGGAFTADNIVPACASCNYRKHQRLPEDWCHPETYDRIIAYFASLDLTPNGDRPLREPKGYATGERHGSRTHPERVVRGENHYARQNPERVAHGENQGSAKLTEQKVAEIYLRYHAGGVSQAALASAYGVTQTVIGRIVRRKSWTHVTERFSSGPQPSS